MNLDRIVGAEEFLDGVFGDVDRSVGVVCVGKLGRSGRGFRQMRRDEMPDIGSRRGQGAWYFCCSLVSGVRRAWDKSAAGADLADEDSYLSRRLDDARSVCCVVLDDVGTKVDAEACDLPAPSWKLETSPGNFQWGYILDPGSADWELFDGFMELLRREGCTDEGSLDRVHMFRLPGSVNQKPEHQGYVSVLRWWDPDLGWSLDDLVDLFGFSVSECRSAAGETRSGRRSAGGGVSIEAPSGGVPDPVLDWLVSTGGVLSDQGLDFVQVRCPWASEHTDPGDEAAAYSPLGRGGSEHAAYRGFKCLHAHCVGRRGKQFLEWVSASGGPWAAVHDPLPWLQQRYVFVEQGSRVVDLERRASRTRGWVMKLTEFGHLHAGKMMTPMRTQPVSISLAWLEEAGTRKAADIVYKPGEPELFSLGDARFVNEYIPPVHASTSSPPAVFLEHVGYLLPDDGERALFLDWLAFKAQNPGRRSFGVVMVAEGYGTGRSWIGDLLRLCLADVGTIELGKLTGTRRGAEYNTWQKKSQLVVIEEARDGKTTIHDYYNAYETLKTVVDVRVSSGEVNDKYGSLSTEEHYYCVLVFSNHRDALAIPPDDRRFAVLSNPALRLEKSYYDRLWESLESGEPARLWHWLLSRDVSGFDPVYPPMTLGKERMAALSLPGVDGLASKVLATMPGEVTTWRQFLSAVKTMATEEDEELPSDMRQLRRLFKRQTDQTELRARLRPSGIMERFRAIRNAGYWRGLSNKEGSQLACEEALKNGDPGEKGPYLAVVPKADSSVTSVTNEDDKK